MQTFILDLTRRVMEDLQNSCCVDCPNAEKSLTKTHCNQATATILLRQGCTAWSWSMRSDFTGACIRIFRSAPTVQRGAALLTCSPNGMNASFATPYLLEAWNVLFIDVCSSPIRCYLSICSRPSYADFYGPGKASSLAKSNSTDDLPRKWVFFCWWCFYFFRTQKRAAAFVY